MPNSKTVIAVITEELEIIRCVHSEADLKQILNYPKLYKVIQPHGLLTESEFDSLMSDKWGIE